MTRAVAVIVVLVAVLSGACNRGSADPLTLDGRPRVPDVEGVVAEVSFTELTMESGDTYEIRRGLRCFSTYTLEPLPLLEREGQYVQLGLDGSRVEWLASIGGVVGTDDPAVYYTGHLVEVEGGRAVFRDGTTFALADGVSAPEPGFVQVSIDPAEGVLRAFF